MHKCRVYPKRHTTTREDVIYEYESGKLIEARVSRVCGADRYEIRILHATSRRALPPTECGTWDDGVVLEVSGSQLRGYEAMDEE